MLHLHHADRLEPLLVEMASVLSVPPADAFQPDVVVVPTVGMGDAAMAGLGQRLGASGSLGDGVVANIEFIFPGQFVSRALGREPGVRHQLDRWHVSALTWSVLELVASGDHDVPGPDRSTHERWALARRIADLFDRYATQRPDLIMAWAKGRDEDGTGAELPPNHQWQARLWRAVRRTIGEPSPPEQLPMLFDALSSGQVTPQLPDRVCLFGFGSVAPAQLRVLQALGGVRDVHLFLRHPSRGAWESVETGVGGRLVARTSEDVVGAVRHPLLGSWGRPALETRSLIVGVRDIEWRSVSSAPPTPPSSLLAALQAGVHLDRAPARIPHLDASDGSVQVHACHGETRQIEALRDALGHLFVADPTLAAHDVVVLCPDLDRFAPLIEAVFARGALPVAVRIGDRSLSTAEPIVEALQAALVLVSGRATLSEMLALAQFEPVRRRFGWTLDDVEQLAHWCGEIGAKWGLEAGHRAEWGVPGSVRSGTWRSFVDQLLAGSAIAAPTPHVVLGDVVPYDPVGADELDLIGSVADLVARLIDLHDLVRDERPVGEWIELLQRLVDDLCAVDPDEMWRRQAVLGQLRQIDDAALGPDGPNRVLLGLADVRALLADGLHDRPGRLPLRSGAVTVSSLVPQSGVPARVVCLLGLDDGTLRGGSFDGDDILGVRPCIGERHPRFESRQLLLDAVLSARDALLITCTGADITTNKATPFTVPLVELLDTVGDLVDLDDQLGPVVVRHPRHGFDDRALRPSGLGTTRPGPFTFDPAMLDAALAKRSASASTLDAGDAWSRWALPPAPISHVDLDELLDAVRRPAQVYLRRRLDIRLPGESVALEDGLPVEASALHRAQLGRELLAALGSDSSVTDVAEWREAVRLHGWLPPGELGSATIQTVSEQAELLQMAAQVAGVPVHAVEAIEVEQAIEVEIAGRLERVELSGTIGHLVVGDRDGCLVDVRYGTTKPWHRLTAALRLAVLHRERPDLDWTAVVIGRPSSGTAPVTYRLRVRRGDETDGDAVDRLLRAAITVLWWARHDVVPLLDETSFQLAAGQAAKARAAFEGDDIGYDEHAAMVWSEVSFDDFLAVEVPERLDWLLGPGGHGGGSTGGCAARAASWIWGAYRAAIDETETKLDAKTKKAMQAAAMPPEADSGADVGQTGEP
jgi:exodeoxyribonuclease V gamma subunit